MSIPSISENNQVRVVCGANEGWFPLVGKTIGSAKKALREVFNINYFSDALVNGRIADIMDTLSAGDSLEFVFPFGFKGAGEGISYEHRLAEDLIAADKELQTIRKRVNFERLSNDETVLLVTNHFIRRYGDKPADNDTSTFMKVARQLIVTAVELTNLHNSGQSAESVKRVHFEPNTQMFYVNGKPKNITKPPKDVLLVLYEADADGLSKDQLVIRSKHMDAVNIFKRLKTKDPDWAAVINCPGKPHGGYRLG